VLPYYSGDRGGGCGDGGDGSDGSGARGGGGDAMTII
jgi:hypothetical protein